MLVAVTEGITPAVIAGRVTVHVVPVGAYHAVLVFALLVDRAEVAPIFAAAGVRKGTPSAFCPFVSKRLFLHLSAYFSSKSFNVLSRFAG